MIYLETDNLYYNTQVYFKKHYVDNLPNDDKVWAQEYRKWLAEQGATIVRFNHNVVVTSLGVAPQCDKFGFENEKDATMFVLRWA